MAGSGAAAIEGSGAGAGGAEVAGFAAGAPNILTPQFEQKASPAGFSAPQDGQCCVPVAAGCGAGWLVAAAAGSGAAPASGSPHSSQKAEPSGFS